MLMKRKTLLLFLICVGHANIFIAFITHRAHSSEGCFITDVKKNTLKRLGTNTIFKGGYLLYQSNRFRDSIESSEVLPKGATANIISIQSSGFLKNIIDYGNARMSRKAVGILSKMPAYREIPVQEHYTAAIWACERGDQFELAMSVYEEMKSKGITPIVSTFEALISVAEKTGHGNECMNLFQEMQGKGIEGSTQAYTSCMWATEQFGRYDLALDLIKEMEGKGIPRDESTYAACIYSCEKVGEGNFALHVIDLMRNEGFLVDTPIYKAAMWACVKNGGMSDVALKLFDEMKSNNLIQNEECYNAAIWACVGISDWKKAVELLKLMKFEGLSRDTPSFDGALTALQQAGTYFIKTTYNIVFHKKNYIYIIL